MPLGWGYPLSLMSYTGRLRPKVVPFQASGKWKGMDFIKSPSRFFAQKAKSRGDTLTRAYIKESTYRWNIKSVCQTKNSLEQGPHGIFKHPLLWKPGYWASRNREEKSLRHVAMLAKLLHDNKWIRSFPNFIHQSCVVFTYLIKWALEIRKFDIAVVQRRLRRNETWCMCKVTVFNC